MSSTSPSGERLRGADRVLVALKHVAGHPRGVTLDALAAELGEPKSSVHRALATLARAGFVEQEDRGGRYRLGLELMRMVFSSYEQWEHHDVVQPILERLATRFGETAHYARLDGAEIVYLAKVTPAAGGVQMTSVVGGRNPAHCTGVGKALLAWQLTDAAAVERYVREHAPLQQRTPSTLVDATSLEAEFRQIRRDGYALDREESEIGINCIAFPVFLESPRHPIGAISVAAVAQRTPLADLVDAVAEIREAIRPYGAMDVRAER